MRVCVCVCAFEIVVSDVIFYMVQYCKLAYVLVLRICVKMLV